MMRHVTVVMMVVARIMMMMVMMMMMMMMTMMMIMVVVVMIMLMMMIMVLMIKARPQSWDHTLHEASQFAIFDSCQGIYGDTCAKKHVHRDANLCFRPMPTFHTAQNEKM